MKKRVAALLTALGLLISLGVVSALAQGRQTDEQAEDPSVSAMQDAAGGGEQDGAQSPEEAANSEKAENGQDAENADASEKTEEEASEPEHSLAGPDRDYEALAENVTVTPDAVGTVSFANLERRIRQSNLTVLGLQENISVLETLDYDAIESELRQNLNDIAEAQWAIVNGIDSMKGVLEQLNQGINIMVQDPVLKGILTGITGVESGLLEMNQSASSLDSVRDALEEQLEAIRSGEMQEDNEGMIRMLENTQDQIVMGGEAMYIALTAMEHQAAGLERQLKSLDRTVEEMDLRYQLGQVSALQVQQVKAGRTSLSSGIRTLEMNLRNYKMQLEVMLGAEITGEIALGELPAVTAAELAKMDEEADLASAMKVSYTVYDAKQKLADAKEAYEEAGEEHGYNGEKAAFRSAMATWEAAQYTYNASIQSYELSFRTLYAQVQDYVQILRASETSLECQLASYKAAELRYQQGQISKNALLNARDELASAEDTVTTNQQNLFSAYNNYCWAVQHGILN